MSATQQQVEKRGWSLYENTMVINHLPFRINVLVDTNENRQLEIRITAAESLKGLIEENES